MKADRGLWLAALIGAAASLVIGGVAMLDPRETRWLLLHTDTATAFLGWQFFRQAPLAQLPFGANPAYGMEISSSVVFSDSIPLLAFLFKPLSGVLPAAFQYFSMWLAISFVLQSVLGYRLLLRFCPDRAFALIGAAFFALAPPFLFRLSGHYALCGQWLVLAALYLYFGARFRPLAWTLLLAVSALVHFYLLLIVSSIWIADLWQRRWRNEVAPRRAAVSFACGALVTGMLLWMAGYFTVGGAAVVMQGFGFYRMNLAAMVDPDGLWSAILPDVPGRDGEFEGFSYLGTGMLLLAPLAGWSLLYRRPALERETALPLAVVSLVLIVLALSNRVGLGTLELFAYPVPELMQPFASLLRSSGRLAWPVFYLLYLAILVLVWRNFRRSVAVAICALCFVVQIVDAREALGSQVARLTRAPDWQSPLGSPLWRQLGARYRNVAYVLPRNAPDVFLPWAVFAAEHGMRINFGYFARVDAQKLVAARTALENRILANDLRADTLYVFESAALWNMATSQKRPADLAGVLDGFRIIAPGLAECASCDPRVLRDLKPEGYAGYALGERISFALGATGLRQATAGWALPESWGVWSQAPRSSVIVKLGQLPERGELLLTVEARAFVDERQPRQQVQISVNGVALETLAFTSRTGESRTLRVPPAALDGSKGLLVISFAFPDARAPTRPALGLMALKLEERKAGGPPSARE